MAAKLCDGLFIGDFETAQDIEFIVANKISRVVNCAGREVANAWERVGVRYLTFFWPESGNCVVFDETNAVLDEVYAFVDEALEAGDAVLIHSTDGASRACFCAAVYFMLKFRWALRKTLAFMQSKRPDLQPRPGFLRQLQALDTSLQRVGVMSGRGVAQSGEEAMRAGEWAAGSVPAGADDELLLVHTFLNSQPAHEDVVVAAQSSAWLPREPAGTLAALCRRLWQNEFLLTPSFDSFDSSPIHRRV